METVLSRTADTLESIECELGILLADKESNSEQRWEWTAGVRAPPRCAYPSRSELSLILIINHKNHLKSRKIKGFI
jgi:hypothetical protein